MKTIALVIGGAALAAAAFWFGRSAEPVRAEPPVAERAVPTRVERSGPVRPSLARRAPVAGLAADLVAADPKIRRAAVAEAARGDADPEVMLAASRDPDLDVARTAIASLNTLYAEGKLAPEAMLALAADRAIPDRARILALNGAGAVPEPKTAALLVTLLAKGSLMERRAAAALLGNQEPEVAVPALIAALGDADEYVRLQAADSLRLRARGRDFGYDAGAWQAWWQSRR